MKKLKFGDKVAYISQQPDTTPKYVGFDYIESVYGISKGRIYPCLKDGRIKSISIVDPGASRGKRLVNVASLEAFIKNLEDAETSI